MLEKEKKKRGRPKKKDTKGFQVKSRFSYDEICKLEALCYEHDFNRSEAIRYAIAKTFSEEMT